MSILVFSVTWAVSEVREALHFCVMMMTLIARCSWIDVIGGYPISDSES